MSKDQNSTEYEPQWLVCPAHPSQHSCYSSRGCRTPEAKRNHYEKDKRLLSRNPAHTAHRRKLSLARYHDGRSAERYADQLERGEQIPNYGALHLGMAALKARLGDPRPDGHELALINHDGPDTYVASSGNGAGSRVSTNPSDYGWMRPADHAAFDAARRRAAQLV